MLSTWKTLLGALAVPLLLTATPIHAAYPDKPVRIVVPYSPGGSSDVMARAFIDQLSVELGQPVIIENRAGAGSMIATSYVANEAADGYTLLIADVPFTIVPALYDNLRYDAQKDFSPIALLGVSPTYLFVNPSQGAKTVPELVAAAKAKPGSMSIGSGGNGSLTHLMAELFMLETGTELVHVPYKGAGAAVSDLAGGQIAASFTTMPTAAALYSAGRIVPLGVPSPERQSGTPDVPTFEELGLSGVTVESWWGLVARSSTPSEVIERLEAAMAKVIATPEVAKRFAGVGVAVPADTSSSALRAVLKEDFARWKEVVERAGVDLQ